VAAEIREGDSIWIGVQTNVWVKRDSIIKVEIRGSTRGL